MAGKILLAAAYLRRHGWSAAAKRLWRALRPAPPASGPADPRYAAWLADNPFGPAEAAALRAAVAALPDPPRFSVVMPVYNPPPALLEQAVASVVAQIYPHWELCVADDASPDPAARAVLQRWAAAEPRIRLDCRAENGGISRATNAAAALAQGAFLAFLDHDDLLAPDALAEMALAVAAAPDADFLYSDDDKIDMDGRRYAPQFKPGWSPVLLLSYMYVGHLKVVRRTLFEALGGFRAGFEGSQDHDFALRVAERARRGVHVPKILYHWRAAPGSTAVSGDAKPAAFEAGRRAVAEALARRGAAVPVPVPVIQPPWAARDRLGVFAPQFPDHGPTAAIIVHGGDPAARRACRRALAAHTVYAPCLVADEDTPPAGLTADYLLFFDAGLLRPGRAGWLGPMMGYAGMAGVGAVDARPAAGDYGYLLHAIVPREIAAVDAAGSPCLLTPRQLYLDAGAPPLSAYPAALAAAGRSLIRLPAESLRWRRRPAEPPPVDPPWGHPHLAYDDLGRVAVRLRRPPPPDPAPAGVAKHQTAD